MEKPIIKDEAFLAQKSQPATFMEILSMNAFY